MVLKIFLISNKELEEELHKPIIRKFNKRKVHSPFMDNILGRRSSRFATDKQIKKGFRFLLLLIFTANMCGLLLYKIKKELQLLTPSKKF